MADDGPMAPLNGSPVNSLAPVADQRPLGSHHRFYGKRRPVALARAR